MFSVEAMSKMFRGKYIDILKKAYVNKELILPGKIVYLLNKNAFYNFINVLWKKEWVVYSKKPFSDPETVLEYLSRYTHRVAIANHRIVSITSCTESRFDRESDGKVTFKYKDRKNDNIDKEMTLPAVEFIRRFLLHVLPEKFMKIRYYGFLGNRNRKDNVRLCRELLYVDYVESSEKSTLELPVLSIAEVMGVNITTCPIVRKVKCK